DLPTGSQCALADLTVVHRPARPMLHPLVAGSEEIAVKARHIVALLYQLELYIAGIGKRDRYFEIITLALVAEFIHGQLLGVEPRADAAYLGPVVHRLLDIAHDDPDLPHRPEQPAHRPLPSGLNRVPLWRYCPSIAGCQTWSAVRRG